MFVVTKAIRTVPKSYPVTVKPNQLEQAEARLHSMPSKRGENEIYRVRELVVRFFPGITSMRNNCYSWEEITQWFIQEFPDAPISPRTLQEYWRSVKAQKDTDKKPPRRSSTPKKSSSKVIASTRSSPKSEKLDVIAIPEPQPLDPIVDPIVDPIDPIVDPIVEPQPTSVPDGHWSQEEMEGYFNHY
jgi:hypothetical protein